MSEKYIAAVVNSQPIVLKQRKDSRFYDSFVSCSSQSDAQVVADSLNAQVAA